MTSNAVKFQTLEARKTGRGKQNKRPHGANAATPSEHRFPTAAASKNKASAEERGIACATRYGDIACRIACRSASTRPES
ncbi:hypothetical protein [Xanthomonas albilineans]|uniref:hypothetical protein n=1 Tax=Xanthomonas albilineans TaxID=29447 RepID=UPI0012D3BA6B|nr:hypothetical protein [Xanthomonas albilineans]